MALYKCPNEIEYRVYISGFEKPPETLKKTYNITRNRKCSVCDMYIQEPFFFNGYDGEYHVTKENYCKLVLVEKDEVLH